MHHSATASPERLEAYPNIVQLFDQKPYLVWDTSDHKQIPLPSAIKAILSYGDYEDFRILLKEVDIQKVASIFKAQCAVRGSYKPSTAKFFSLYFQAHA